MSLFEQDYPSYPLFSADLKGFIHRIKAGLSPIIVIKTGYMEGISRNLLDGGMKVGSSADSDLILIDEGINGCAFDIQHVRTFLFSTLKITAKQNKILLNNKTTLLTGNSASKSLPFLLSVEGVQIKFCEPEFISKKFINSICSGLFFLIFLLLSATTIWQQSVEKNYVKTIPIASQETVKKENEKEIQFDISKLKEKVVVLGLAKLINISDFDEYGRVEISGIVPTSASNSWRDLSRWTDVVGAGLIIEKNVSFEPIESYGRLIAGVSVEGEQKQVILTTMELLSLGDELINGWVIKAITPSIITIGKSNYTFHISLTEGSR